MMKITITKNGTCLSLQASTGATIQSIQAISLVASDTGVQLLVHLDDDSVEIETDGTSELSEVLEGLLAQLDEEE